MYFISTSYDLIWRHKHYHNYQWTDKGVCVNVTRGKVVKHTICGGSKGWCIKGKFMSEKQLRTQIEKIPIELLPF